jgi:hypothetical protein
MHYRSFVSLVACASAASVNAGIINWGFEDSALSLGSFTDVGINGWTWNGTSGV